MDPDIPSERKWDWGMMTGGLVVPSRRRSLDLLDPFGVWFMATYIYSYC